MCNALQRECSGRYAGAKKALEWAEARMTESLLLSGVRQYVFCVLLYGLTSLRRPLSWSYISPQSSSILNGVQIWS